MSPKIFIIKVVLTVWSRWYAHCRDCIRNLRIYSCITITSVIGANRGSWWIQLRGILNVKCCTMSSAGRAYNLCVSCTRTLREYAKLQSLLSNLRLIIMRVCESIANSRMISRLYMSFVQICFSLRMMSISIWGRLSFSRYLLNSDTNVLLNIALNTH